jgi:hypothetical protein
MIEKTDYDVVEDSDGIAQGHAKTPKGWLLYVGATVAWMIYYVYAYTPFFTGWTQSQAIDVLTK